MTLYQLLLHLSGNVGIRLYWFYRSEKIGAARASQWILEEDLLSYGVNLIRVIGNNLLEVYLFDD